MCKGCWQEAGAPTELPDNYQQIVHEIARLYAIEECQTGGPLHVQIEDYNAEIDWVPWPGLPGDPFGPAAMTQAQVVADLMQPLPVSQRFAVLAKYGEYF